MRRMLPVIRSLSPYLDHQIGRVTLRYQPNAMLLLRCAQALMLLLPCAIFAQAPPAVEWQRNLGGSGSDVANSVAQTPDGGYILCGTTESNNGDVSGFQGVQDIWVVKLDASGNIQWERSLGGSSNDFGEQALPLADGGFLVIGGTRSNNGNVSGNHGMYDAWLAKLDANGNLIWQRCYGGAMNDWARSAKATLDGGFLIAGASSSSDGDVTSNAGFMDYWILKVDALGAILWQRSFGGSMSEDAFAIALTNDGGCVVLGSSSSSDGDVSGSHGSLDQWIIKLDENGDLEWQRPSGGSGTEFGFAIAVLSDETILAVGGSDSQDGDVTTAYGDYDLWAIQLTPLGAALEDRSYGGSGSDIGREVLQIGDNGLVYCGSSTSNNGDLESNQGALDGWLFRTNGQGDIVWNLSLGGSLNDSFEAMQATSDGGYILVGASESNNGDLPGNNGSSDVWVVKLGADPLSVAELSDMAAIRVFPNPSKDHIQVQLPLSMRNAQWQLHDAQGRVVVKGREPGTSLSIDLQHLASGAYTLVVEARGERQSVVVVKE